MHNAPPRVPPRFPRLSLHPHCPYPTPSSAYPFPGVASGCSQPHPTGCLLLIPLLRAHTLPSVCKEVAVAEEA
eukprot:7048683-Prorocentrum_lima.AAC.1